MKASDWNRRLTLPGRTYCLTIVGSWVSADSLQKGHWRSANSVTFTGAFARPSVVPCCGTPANSAVVALDPETDPDDAAVELDAVEPECEAETAMSTAAAAAAAPSTAPRRSRRLRRAAAARCALSRSTRARRASSRRSLRVGWEIVGMWEVLLRAGSARRGRTCSAATTEVVGGSPAVSGRARSQAARDGPGRRR